jgi:hypothetical protein
VGSLLFFLPLAVEVVPVFGGEGGAAGDWTGIFIGTPSG